MSSEEAKYAGLPSQKDIMSKRHKEKKFFDSADWAQKTHGVQTGAQPLPSPNPVEQAVGKFLFFSFSLLLFFSFDSFDSFVVIFFFFLR